MAKAKKKATKTIKTVAQILQEAESEGRTITPSGLVELAKDPKHPLHRSFDWNNTTAGPKWRIEQARKLICNARVLFTVIAEHPLLPQHIPSYVRDTRKAGNEQGMISCHAVLDSATRKAENVKRELDRMESFIQRAFSLATLSGFEAEFYRRLDKWRAMKAEKAASV